MWNKKDKSMKRISIGVIILLFFVAIFLGKIVRYSVMKESLVDVGIGWNMIKYINQGNIDFGLTIKNEEDTDVVGATDNANAIFSFINVFGINTYYGFEIYISVIWNIILLIIIINLKKSFSVFETIFILASVSVLNIFNFCLAKEPIQMLYFILMYLILISNKSDKFKFIMCDLIFLLCSLTYRNYYILMFAFMIFAYLMYKYVLLKISKVKFKHIILVLFLIFICYFTFLNVAKVIDINAYNELIRVRLRTSGAASDMRTIFKSNNLFVFTIDYLIMLIRMLIPIELIKLGPKYIIYVVYQVLITSILIKNFIGIKKISNTRKIAIYIFIAFLMGSAAFEPDFGSWIRHESVLFPIILVIANIKEKKDILEYKKEKI